MGKQVNNGARLCLALVMTLLCLGSFGCRGRSTQEPETPAPAPNMRDKGADSLLDMDTIYNTIQLPVGGFFAPNEVGAVAVTNCLDSTLYPWWNELERTSRIATIRKGFGLATGERAWSIYLMPGNIRCSRTENIPEYERTVESHGLKPKGLYWKQIPDWFAPDQGFLPEGIHGVELRFEPTSGGEAIDLSGEARMTYADWVGHLQLMVDGSEEIAKSDYSYRCIEGPRGLLWSTDRVKKVTQRLSSLTPQDLKRCFITSASLDDRSIRGMRNYAIRSFFTLKEGLYVGSALVILPANPQRDYSAGRLILTLRLADGTTLTRKLPSVDPLN